MTPEASGVIHIERVTGIEPALSAWEADVLPLNYTRADQLRSDQHLSMPDAVRRQAGPPTSRHESGEQHAAVNIEVNTVDAAVA